MLEKDEKFNNGSYLYHYTSISSACKILKNNSLKFNKLKRMNDINESYRPLYSDLDKGGFPIKPLEKATKEIIKYAQISFTKDRNKNKGFYIPAMWAHYAGKGRGVCLVFDKKKLLTELNKLDKIDNNKSLRNNVKYQPLSTYYPGIIIKDNENVEEYITGHRKDIFLEKSSDWSYEQEYRIVKREGTFLPLGDSLKYIIVYGTGGQSAFGAFRLNPLKEVCRDYANQVKIIEVGKFLGGELNLRYEVGKEIWSSEDRDSYEPDIGNR